VYIANETVTLIDCTFANNFSNDSGGAINVNGPDGPPTLTTLYVVRCTFNNNQAPNNGGGAISSYVPLDLSINESTFRFNWARGGGAIGQFVGGSLNIFASTFYANEAQAVDGGALFLNSAFTSVLITNSTFAQNAANNNGGAIALMTVSSIASPGLSIFNSTFGNNGALLTGGAICRREGSTANIAITSTVFWSNGAGQNAWGPDCYTEGTLSADRVLMSSTAGIATFNPDAFTTANVGVSPRINFLASNGGLTETYSLKPGSVALDNGSNPLGFSFDQRGVGYARNKDGNCNGTAVVDIGAFEVQACLCPGDVTGNGSTDIDDLVLIITTWGATWNGYPADLNNDGLVNIDDLVLVITDWGICQ
jgi:predicted outer membrane repeat protein